MWTNVMWYYVDAFLPSNSWLIALLLIHWVEMLLLCVNIACTKKSGLFGSSDQNFILYRASSSTLSLNTSAYNVVFIVQAEAKYNCCLCRQADSGHTNWKIHVLTLFPLRQTSLPLCLWHKTNLRTAAASCVLYRLGANLAVNICTVSVGDSGWNFSRKFHQECPSGLIHAGDTQCHCDTPPPPPAPFILRPAD